MSSLFERLKGRREPTSAEIAKERLKLVLVTDRSNLSPEKLSEMQAEIIQVIKRYIQIEELDVQIKLEQRDRKNYLVADIPLTRDHTYQPTGAAPTESAAALGDQSAAELDAPAEEESADEEAEAKAVGEGTSESEAGPDSDAI